MVVLAMVLIWFGLQRREQSVERFVEPPGSADDPLPPLLDALRYAMAAAGAQFGAIAWADEEEPDIEVRSIGHRLPHGPDLARGAVARRPVCGTVTQLFDQPRKRILRVGGWRCIAVHTEVHDPFRVHCALEQGLALPFSAVTGRGEFLLAGIPGVGADHVEMGSLDRRAKWASGSTARRRWRWFAKARSCACATRSRAISMTPSRNRLSGVSLRLEGLRRWIRDGGDPDTEIQAIKSALRAEQSHVRGMIDRLRQGDSVLPDGTAARTSDPCCATFPNTGASRRHRRRREGDCHSRLAGARIAPGAARSSRQCGAPRRSEQGRNRAGRGEWNAALDGGRRRHRVSAPTR